LSLLLTIFCGTFYVREAGQVERVARDREQARVRLLATLFQSELRPAASHLNSFATSGELRSFVNSPSPDTRAAVTDWIAALSRQHPEYDVIRYLDESGVEVIRVNRSGEITPSEQLQNKNSREYFRSASRLPRGHVFISAFDLRTEHGRVVEPYIPTLRLATPVHDREGRSRGVCVISYSGEQLIYRLLEAAPLFTQRFRLLNADGFWLKARSRDREWGFLRSGGESWTLAQEDPNLWTQASSEPDGQTRFSGGLFTWRRITPSDFLRRDAVEVVAQDRFLLIASEITAEEWQVLFTGVRRLFLLVAAVLITLIVSTAWFFWSRQEALLALRRSEEGLAVTMNSIGDAVLATDTSGRVTRINRAAEELTGWRAQDARGRASSAVLRIVDEHTRQPVEAEPEMVEPGKATHRSRHLLLIGRNGAERPISSSIAPILDRNGQVQGRVVVFRDVTSDRAAEERLETALRDLAREQERIQRVFDSVPVGISFTINRPGVPRTRLINSAHLRICGLTREQVEERGVFSRITHPDDREEQAELMRQLDEGAIGQFSVDKRYVRDGQIIWVMLTFQRKTYPDGSHEDLSIVLDITDRKEAEAKVQRQNAQLRALFESLPGLFLVLTPDLKIVTASEAYLQATMTRRDAIIGHGLFEIFPDNPADLKADGSSNLRSSLERVLTSGKPDTMAIQKYDIRRPDGELEEKYWSPMNSPMFGADGRIEYLIHRVEDVTEFVRQRRGQSAHDASALRTRMQQMEAEIFQSSKNVQLANQQLRAANAELESFSYTVSHDLRAPLRHIHGYVEMLSRDSAGQLSDKSQRYLRTIAEAGREMGELIDNLLAFSRMGRTEMREATVDLNGLIDEVRRDLHLVTQGRAIEWSVQILPDVKGDAAMIKQVFANLLGNAVKYSRLRDVAKIEVGYAFQEDGHVEVHVRDNGAGFEMKYADKLFGVFQRLHRTDEFEGTGIGLASVRRIMTRHGGRTWGVGEPNVGATFFVTFQPAFPTTTNHDHSS
jgi:PAS domain S-box-containing protein